MSHPKADANSIDCDVLIIGGGGAGARAAVEAGQAGARVVVALKDSPRRSGITPMAHAGMEAALDPADTVEQHFQDTLKAGRGLADEDLAWSMVAEAPQCIRDLDRFGTRFKKKEDGSFDLYGFSGHSAPRSVKLIAGAYGIVNSLFAQLRPLDNVIVLPDTLVIELLRDGERVAGALVLDVRSGEFRLVRAKTVILASGGYQELWPVTDTAPDSTGDGLALAYEAGARCVDLEMLLYYPCVVVYPNSARGVVFGYEMNLNPAMIAGRLVNGREEPFFDEIPLRDVMVQLIHCEIREGRGTPHGGVYLDIVHSPLGKEKLTAALDRWYRVPFRHMLKLGVDVREQMLEVAPAAHFQLGGVHIDVWGQTTVPGLYAAGEVAGNVHGANRLGGNALSETQVYGARSARRALEYGAGLGQAPIPQAEERLAETSGWVQECKARYRPDGLTPLRLKRKIQSIMDKYIGLERTEQGCKQAQEELDCLKEQDLPHLCVPPVSTYCYPVREAFEVRAMITLADLTIRSAMARRETRGHHQRLDFPNTLPDSAIYHTSVQRVDGKPRLELLPIRRRQIVS